jgi:hypothetical protein
LRDTAFVRCALLIALSSVACLRAGEFKCETSADCVRSGVAGICESNQFCSFPDDTCESGNRFGDLSGSSTNQCVAPTDGPLPPLEGGGGCPATYTMVGTQAHQYREIANGQWMGSRDACATDGANVYLWLPDDQTELDEVLAFSGTAGTWLGINDIATEGTFVTVKNTTPTFLPFAGGEPDNGAPAGDEDCLRVNAGKLFEDRTCTTNNAVICECEP